MQQGRSILVPHPVPPFWPRSFFTNHTHASHLALQMALDPSTWMESIYTILGECQGDLNSLEGEFGLTPFNHGGRRKRGQSQEAKLLGDALKREYESMEWLKRDLLDQARNRLDLVPGGETQSFDVHVLPQWPNNSKRSENLRTTGLSKLTTISTHRSLRKYGSISSGPILMTGDACLETKTWRTGTRR